MAPVVISYWEIDKKAKPDLKIITKTRSYYTEAEGPHI